MPVPDEIAELYQAAIDRDPAAEAPLREALARFTDAGDGPGIAWTCLALARYATARRDYEEAIRLFDHGVACVRDQDRLALAKLLNACGSLMLEQDRWPAALVPLIAASRTGDEFPREALRAKQNMAFCLLGLRDFPGAAARFREARLLFEGVDSLYVANVYGTCLATIRGGDLALAHAELAVLDGIRRDRPGIDHRLLGRWSHVRAELAAAEGRWSDARNHARDGMDPDADLGASAHSQLARIGSRAAAATGDRAEAERLLADALLLPLGPDERHDLLRWASELAEQNGDTTTALARLQEAMAANRDDGMVGRAVAQVLERAAQGSHEQNMELAAANEALNRAYESLDKLRRQLEERVEERTRALAAEVEIRSQAEQLAIRSNQAKSTFLANMSHELRTPLNVIIGYAEMFEEDLDGAQAVDAGTIRRSGRHLLGMIDQVLDLSRIEAGHLPVQLEPTDLVDLLDDVAREAEALMHPNRNTLVRQGDPAGPPFSTDALRLRQILLNLLANAAKFTEQGTITLGIRRADPRIELWVSDTGIGIPAEHLPRLFQPFEQVDPTSTRRHGGAGLGLSICRELAQRLGGSLSVTSTPGRGSTFTVTVEPASRSTDAMPA